MDLLLKKEFQTIRICTLKKITLSNGSVVLIQNKLYIKAFKMVGDEKRWYVYYWRI
jgi:hypothetical protein